MSWAQTFLRDRFFFFFFLLYFLVEKHTSYSPFIFIVGSLHPTREF